jgi:endonuclease/exonuclease/phosphatase (EEP) superfamily protein YafD
MRDSTQQMTTSLAVQDRNKSTGLGKIYEARPCYGTNHVLQVKLPRPACYTRYNLLQKGKITQLNGKSKNQLC